MSKQGPWLLIAASLGFLMDPTLAVAARWWNPFTWFERSESAKIADANYRTDRKDLLATLEEAKQSGDRQTIKQARAELRTFDKAHAKRIREMRKETHQVMREEHKATHRLDASERKAITEARGDRAKSGLEEATPMSHGRSRTTFTPGMGQGKPSSGRGGGR